MNWGSLLGGIGGTLIGGPIGGLIGSGAGSGSELQFFPQPDLQVEARTPR